MWEALLGSKPSPPAPSGSAKLIAREEIHDAPHGNSFSNKDVIWLLLRDGLSLYLYTNKNKPQNVLMPRVDVC